MRCLSPKNITPKKSVENINDISAEELRRLGIRSLIFDVDNTLCPYNGVSVDARVEEGFRILTQDFNSCILSNTNAARMLNLESYFGIPVIRSGVRKPLPEAFLLALDYLKTDPADTAMIGDRLLSDIAGANMAGLLTIRVNPLERGSEPFAHSLARGFETFVHDFYSH